MASQPTQQQSATFTPEQHNALALAANGAEPSQLSAAADFVFEVLQANAIPFAFMGGFALKLRGSNRETHDVDVAVGCTMQRLIEVLSPHPRIRRPAGPMSGVMRIFVQVGGQLNAGIPEIWVDAGSKLLPVIDILSAMTSKLNAFHARKGLNDYEDISFLITDFPKEVHAIRAQLSATHRQYFVEAFSQENSQNATRRVKHVLGVA